MKHPILAAAIGLFFLIRPLAAAPGDAANPSMNPESAGQSATGKEKTNPFGFAGMGKERPKDAKTEITAKKESSFDNATSVATFEGSVVVKDPQFTLFCDRMVVTLNKNRKGMKLVEAFGNVIIVQDNTDSQGKVIKAIGRAGKAVYEPETGDITLTIWPSMQHGINLQKATEEATIMKLNRNGKSQTTGANQTVIVDTGEQKQN
jgi:lipopolysaccharide transport protein LptA